MHLIIGTAGHVDHGKTTLIRALTGIETDRLREERERGLSIVPGFAHLALPPTSISAQGRVAGIVDVPGHERFLKNMLAGVAGVDVAMLIIAADEGVMPQTVEHLHILELLQVRRAVVVLTKCDAVDAEWLALAREDIQTRLSNPPTVQSTLWSAAPLVEVSASRGDGLDELKSMLAGLCDEIESDEAAQSTLSGRPFRLAIDRAFSVAGFGTVVTGSATQGVLTVSEGVEIWQPGQEHPTTSRVRGLEVHGHESSRVERGQRSAINLAGVALDEAVRGGVVASPGSMRAARLLDVWFRLLSDAPRALKRESSVRVHIGTAEAGARLVLHEENRLERGQSTFARCHLEAPLVAALSDRFVVREVGNERVLGGGVVLTVQPTLPRARLLPFLPIWQQNISQNDDFALAESLLRAATLDGLSVEELRRELRLVDVEPLLHEMSARGVLWRGPVLLHAEIAAQLQEAMLSTLRQFHQEEALQLTMPREHLRTRLESTLQRAIATSLVEAVALQTDEVVVEPGGVRLQNHRVQLSAQDERVRAQIEAIVERAAWQPLTLDEIVAACAESDERSARRLLSLLLRSGVLVRVGDWILAVTKLEEGSDLVRRHFAQQSTLSVAQAREILNTTRKWAVPLLEWFDRSGLTRREGEVRVLKVGVTSNLTAETIDAK